MCQRFGALCLFHLHRQVGMKKTHLRMKMEQTRVFQKLAYKIQTLGNYPEERIQHSEHGKSLKSRIQLTVTPFHFANFIDIHNSYLNFQVIEPCLIRKISPCLKGASLTPKSLSSHCSLYAHQNYHNILQLLVALFSNFSKNFSIDSLLP